MTLLAYKCPSDSHVVWAPDAGAFCPSCGKRGLEIHHDTRPMLDPTTKGDPMNQSIELVPCTHQDEAHTLWMGIDDGGPPVPSEARFNNQADGLAYIEEHFPLEHGRANVWMLKLFPTESGEAYTCWQWSQHLEPKEPTGIQATAIHEGEWEAMMLVESRVDWAKACFAALVVIACLELAKLVLG